MKQQWIAGLSHYEYFYGKLQDHFSSSNARTLVNKSPLHMITEKYGEEKTSPALEFGTNFHQAATDGIESLIVIPKFDGRTKSGKADKAAWLEDNADKTAISQEDMDCFKGMLESLYKHRIANQIFTCAKREMSGVYEIEGVPCKIRADFLDTDRNIIFDLKTTIDASADKFTRSIFNFGYHIQAAWYQHGYLEIEGTLPDFVIVAVEKAPPFEVNVFHVAGDSLTKGYESVQQALTLIRNCMESGEWPGYDQRIHTINVPAWYK